MTQQLDKQLARLYNRLPEVGPPQDLKSTVLARVTQLEERERHLRLAFALTLSVISALLFFPLMNFVISEFSASGFLEYLSLFASDTNLLTAYWQEFGITLLESIPILATALVFALFFALLVTLRLFIQSQHGDHRYA